VFDLMDKDKGGTLSAEEVHNQQVLSRGMFDNGIHHNIVTPDASDASEHHTHAQAPCQCIAINTAVLLASDIEGCQHCYSCPTQQLMPALKQPPCAQSSYMFQARSAAALFQYLLGSLSYQLPAHLPV